MQLFRPSSEAGNPSQNPIFIGDVTTVEVANEERAKLLRVTAVTFHDGARNKLHHHTTDQVLVITDGQGIVASETEENLVESGDIVLIPAGERHWHGAREGKTMTHLSILTPGVTTIDEAS